MQIIRDGDPFPPGLRGAVLAVGNFDGVHRGHKALIDEAISQARLGGRPAGVLVFEPHPREFFHPEEPHFRLTPLAAKLRHLERLGLEFVVVVDFDAALASLPAERFIANVLIGRLGVAHVVIGYDFHFGHRRGGTPETMREAGARCGFGVTVVAQQAEDGEVFSSTAVRMHLAQGDVAGAALVLGHWWQVSGEVVGGNRIGLGLGFPTANIELPAGTALMHGIYAVRVRIDGEIHGGQVHGGAAYFGGRPSVDDGPVRLEVFVFDFEGDLYGREIVVEFVAFIRGDRRFPDFDALKAQMALDCEAARRLLGAAPAAPHLDVESGRARRLPEPGGD